MSEAIRPFKKIWPEINESAYIDPHSVVIGDVHIGAQTSVWPMVVIRGDVNSIRIGECSNIQDGSVLHVTHRSANHSGFSLTVGSRVTVGHQVTLHGCTVQDDSLIGMGSTVLDGAVVESQVLLGAGSLVSPGKVLESGYLWLGRPAKKVRLLTPSELAYFRYSAEHYQSLSQAYQKPD
jgi:carbonic anhydrase/acetyltransferase-like protein (isoleucine patch superfamily)